MALPANNIDLTTVAAVQAYAGTLSGSLAPTSDEYQKLITGISAGIARYCSRKFDQQMFTETRDGRNTKLLVVKNPPIVSVTSLGVDSFQSIPAASGPPWTNGYKFDSFRIYAYDPYAFGCGLQNITFTYLGGYITPGMVANGASAGPVTLPADLEQACIESVADRFSRRTNIGIQSRTLATETVSYTAGDLPVAAQSVVNTYQRKVLFL